MNTVIILPSVMCCEAAEQKGYLKAFEESGVTAIHFDVMDGHYVPNVMLGIRDYNEMKKQTSLPIDVHMMTDKPEEFFEIFQPQAGDWVSFHPETAVNPYRLLQAIRERGCRAGIALSPAVSVEYITELRSVIDFVLVMAVNPGFAGQKMVPDHLDKLARIKKAVQDCPNNVDIIVDGNTTLENSKLMIAKGATGLVVGTSSLLKHSPAEFGQAYQEYLAALR